jgi:hypothetical protein
VFPQRRKVSDDGNYIYAAPGSPNDRMTAWFRLTGVAKALYALEMVGLRCPDPPGGQVAGRVVVNDQVVFEGNVRFAEDGLSTQTIELPAGALKRGVNRIELRNTAKEGRRGGRPWFGIDRVELVKGPRVGDSLPSAQ